MAVYTGKRHVRKSLLFWDSAGGSAYTQMTNILEIDPPEKTVGVANSEDLDDNDRQKIPGYGENKDLKVKFAFNPTLYGLLDAALEAQKATPFVIPNWKYKAPLAGTESVAAQLVFPGIITSLKIGQITSDGEKIKTIEMTVAVSGAVTWTTAS